MRFLALLLLAAALHTEEPAATVPPTITAEDSARIMAEIKAEKAKREAENAAKEDAPTPAELAAKRAHAAEIQQGKATQRELDVARERYKDTALKAYTAAHQFIKDTTKIKPFSQRSIYTEVCRADAFSNARVLSLVAEARHLAEDIRNRKGDLGLKIGKDEKDDDAVVEFCRTYGAQFEKDALRAKDAARNADPNAR